MRLPSSTSSTRLEAEVAVAGVFSGSSASRWRLRLYSERLDELPARTSGRRLAARAGNGRARAAELVPFAIFDAAARSPCASRIDQVVDRPRRLRGFR